MKKTILSVFALAALVQIEAQNADSTYYYSTNGEKVWWYFQHDVYVFRLQNGKEYQNSATDLTVVDKINYQKETPRQLNVMEFKPTANATQRETERGKPRENPNFECEFPVLTKERLLLKDAEKWHTTDDQIAIIFKNALITESEVAQFATRYNLITIHKPYKELPFGTWSYVFQKREDKCRQISTIDLARQIYEQEPALVKSAIPSMAGYVGHSCDNKPSEMSSHPIANYFWFMDNAGTRVYNPNNIGTTDADADICECWNMGYFGDGITVAVLDFDSGFEFSHSDLTDVLLPGWNFTTTPETPMNTDTYSNAGRSHATSVCGLLAGNSNDGKTFGVAPGVKILPILVTNIPAVIRMGIQKAVAEGAHIILMPFGSDVFIDEIQDEIQLATATGRTHPTIPTLALGTVIVASVGNDDRSDKAFYPAAHAEVIGVGASNIQDYRCMPNDPDNTNWDPSVGLIGSNHGDFAYDVVAPGAFLQVDRFGNDETNSKGGTSYSAAIVAGVAAMLLQKNPTLTWQEVQVAINDNADRIRESTEYFYDETTAGSFEVFHGRVSCGKSLNGVTVGINETPVEKVAFQVYEFAPAQFRIRQFGNAHTATAYVLYATTGQKIQDNELSSENTDLDLSQLPVGMYYLQIQNKNANFMQNFKLIVSH